MSELSTCMIFFKKNGVVCTYILQTTDKLPYYDWDIKVAEFMQRNKVKRVWRKHNGYWWLHKRGKVDSNKPRVLRAQIQKTSPLLESFNMMLLLTES